MFGVLLTFYLFQSHQVNGFQSPKVAPFTSLVKPVIGGKTSFTCQSLTGSTPLQINWLKDDKQIEDLPAIKVLTNGEVSTLIIDTIQSTHSGNYTCRITNRYGHDSQSTQLLVEGPPNWINKPSSMKFKLSQSVIMRCAASGYPEPKTQWKRLQGSSWIELNSFNDRIKIEDNRLKISKVNRNDSGIFGCSISNGLEPNLWTEFNLTIEGELFF